MATQAEIKDQAVALLGEEIGIYQAPDIRAAIDSFYESVRNQLLYGYPWSWMITRRTLQQPARMAGSTSDDRYPYRHELPDPDIGQIRAVYSSNQDAAAPEVAGWTREGNFILARWPRIWVEYQRRVDETAFPELFVSALVPLLASRASIQVLQDAEIMMAWKRIADEARDVAQGVDAESKPNEQIEYFSYLEAHWGGDETSLTNRFN